MVASVNNIRRATSLVAPALASIAVAAIGLANTDAWLESSFSSAVADAAGNRTVVARGPAVSGSEDYWLGRLPSGTSPVVWTAPLVAGDRFSMGANGNEHHYVVVGVHQTTLGTPGADKTGAGLLLIEARDEALGASGPTVRLVVDAALAASLKSGSAIARAL